MVVFIVDNSLKVRFKRYRNAIESARRHRKYFGRGLYHRAQPVGRTAPEWMAKIKAKSDVPGSGLARRRAFRHAGGYESRDAENV